MHGIINFSLFVVGSILLTFLYEAAAQRFGWVKFSLPFTCIAAITTAGAIILLLPSGLPPFPEGDYVAADEIAFTVKKIDGKYEATKEAKFQDFDGGMKNGKPKPGQVKTKTQTWTVIDNGETVTFIDLTSLKGVLLKPIDGSNNHYLGDNGMRYERR